MAAPQIPEFAVVAAAYELRSRLAAGDVDPIEAAEAMLKVALPLIASPRLRDEVRQALIENHVEAVAKVPGITPEELAEEAYESVEPYLRGVPPATVHEVTWTRKAYQQATHVEFVEAHYVVYEPKRVRFHKETEEAGNVVLLDADRSDIRTIRRIPQDGEPVPAMPEDDEGGASA